MNQLRARILLFVPIIVFMFLAQLCSRNTSAAKSQETAGFQPRPEIHSWLGKITEAKEMLRGVELKHSAKLVSYKETRKLPPKKGKKTKVISIKKADYAWKEAGLALMNVETGEIKIIKIRKESQKLLNYDGVFLVEIEQRISGLTWNSRNTAFRVVKPTGWVVIADKWIERVNSKPTESIYFPYSTNVHQGELIDIGGWHLDDDTAAAFAELRFRDVKSLTYPEKIVGDVVPAEFTKNLVLTELTDPQEFYAFKSGVLKYNPFDRVKVILAGNGEEAFPTTNYAGAVGLTQFTNNKPKRGRGAGTWDMVRKTYPAAQLPEFKIGAANHTESIKAAILLYDYNLNELAKAFRIDILDDENLNFYLYAAHNCGIGRVIQAIKRTKPGQDWRVALRKLGKTDETIVFLEKVNYLIA